MDIIRQLDADTMSREEMMALDLGRRLHILDALYGEIFRLAELKCTAIDLRTDAKLARDNDNLDKARAAIEKITTMLAARK
ncbi:MAG: hypothetical protein KGL39_34285, partial [Patescibacteria group bacterium]|nr:hypothetical protein [Patescibacteria group bacterium]